MDGPREPIFHTFGKRTLQLSLFDRFQRTLTGGLTTGKGKGRALDVAPQVDTATAEALRYMARTKQRRTYLPYTFLAVAGTHLLTPRGWRVE